MISFQCNLQEWAKQTRKHTFNVCYSAYFNFNFYFARQMLRNRWFTHNLNFTNLLLTTILIEALVTLSNPYNHCGVSQGERIPRSVSTM